MSVMANSVPLTAASSRSLGRKIRGEERRIESQVGEIGGRVYVLLAPATEPLMAQDEIRVASRPAPPVRVMPPSIDPVQETGADEAVRVSRLLDAQVKAAQLFDEVEARELMRAGITERALSNEIRDLAKGMFGVTRHWHKRIVRAGENTLETADENPPDRVIADDDILFLDFGPIFEEWEADFGRTFVLGSDPRKLALRDALPEVWHAGHDYFHRHPDVTGEELFDHVVTLSEDRGWVFGGIIAGHLVGEFPHEKIAGDEIDSYIAPGSKQPMRRKERSGKECHWILEVHLHDEDRRFGGFHEELLDIP